MPTVNTDPKVVLELARSIAKCAMGIENANVTMMNSLKKYQQSVDDETYQKLGAHVIYAQNKLNAAKPEIGVCVKGLQEQADLLRRL